jgi:hypothetical protein
MARSADPNTSEGSAGWRGTEGWITRDYNFELALLGNLAEAAVGKISGLPLHDLVDAPVDDASLAARKDIIALLDDNEALLFGSSGYIVKVIGAQHMLLEESRLALADVAAQAAAGHLRAQRIHHELTEALGIVVHFDGDHRTGTIQFPLDEAWVTDRQKYWRRKLDAAVDRVVADVKRRVAAGRSVGIVLVTLEAGLQPRDAVQVPRSELPPTPQMRRMLIEKLARQLRTAAGYVGVAAGWRNRGAPFVEISMASSDEESVVFQAETRAGDRCVRVCDIIRKKGGSIRFKRLEHSHELQPEGLFTDLLQVADSQAEGRTLDEDLLKTALAAHASTINTLGTGDSLMFGVGEQLVQVIGNGHTIRECTLLQLADIKMQAKAGDPSAQRLYSELVAGQGLLCHVETGEDGVTRGKLKFVADAEWLSEENPLGLNHFSIGSGPPRSSK